MPSSRPVLVVESIIGYVKERFFNCHKFYGCVSKLDEKFMFISPPQDGSKKLTHT